HQEHEGDQDQRRVLRHDAPRRLTRPAPTSGACTACAFVLIAACARYASISDTFQPEIKQQQAQAATKIKAIKAATVLRCPL
ncbi:MAG TPA: hypothetical protein PLH50_08535, partial [Ottowia beijingensis]|nr:hypothetical protein [Ottowia beijingensis]